MKFYKFTHPEYGSDYESSDNNPIRMIEDIWIPGIICPACGRTWAGSRRLYLPIEDETLWRKLSSEPLPLSEWNDLVHKIRTQLKLPEDYVLKPGDVLGPPIAEILDRNIPDFLHPFPGQIIVQSKVIEALQRAELSGFRAIQVRTQWSEQEKPPELYELLVTGAAWRIDSKEEQIIVCRSCHRTKFPNSDMLSVDQNRWDGSDFFHVDGNPNIVLITERACEILTRNKFTNYSCLLVF